MQNKLVNKHSGFYSSQLRLLIVIILLLGIFFRFVNLNRKIYWHDEAYTSLRNSGYTLSEVLHQDFDGHVIGIKDLQKYQHFNPKASLIDAIKNGTEEPQHPPLYYLIARLWVQWFGNSVAVIRSLSALTSLLAFPCMYWLCLELFESSLTAWIAVALIAVSPVHVLYAQEARDYSLWTVTILLSSAALLRAMRLKTKQSWEVYAVTLALGCYTYLLFGSVAIGHGVYVAVTERFRLSKTFTAYLLASVAGIITFAPWLLIVITKPSEIYSGIAWASVKMSPLSLVKRWAGIVSRIFIDFGLDSNDSLTSALPLFIPILIVLFLVGYSIYFIYRQTPKRVWLFTLTLIGITPLALIAEDLIFGGLLSTTARYLFPCFLGIQLTVAYLLATQLTFSVKWQQKLWQIAMIVLISSGVLSCVASSQAEVWWNKGSSVTKNDPEVAHIINQAAHPLLISNTDGGADVGYVMSLSYLLDPKVKLQLVIEPNIPKIADGFSDVFLFRPFNGLRDALKKEYKMETVHLVGDLWRLANLSGQ